MKTFYTGLKPGRKVDMGRGERFGKVEHISFYFVKRKESFDIASNVKSSHLIHVGSLY